MIPTASHASALAKLQRKVRQLLRHLRAAQWAHPTCGGLDRPALYHEEANVRGRPYNVPLFILRTKPCSWLGAGGCSMCNYHLASAMGRPVSRDQLLAQIDFVISQVQGRELPYILITSAGSFLDDRELPEDLRLTLLRRLAAAGLRSLSFECRANFLRDRSRIRKCVEAFAGGALQVGIGLESADPFIRNVIVNKGLPQSVLDSAVATLKSEGVAFYFYVMLGKPFMTPGEDLADTVTTISRAFDLGGFMAVLETVNIQPYTLTKLLYSQGLYSPPNLWSAIETLRRLPAHIRQYVPIKGYEKAEPMPEAFPSTCALCCDSVRAELRRWNLDRQWTALERATCTCDCYADFRRELDRTPSEEPLPARVERVVDHLLDQLALARFEGSTV